MKTKIVGPYAFILFSVAAGHFAGINFGRLTKISNNPNKLRSVVVYGIYLFEPTTGQSFRIVSEPIDKNFDQREVTTSEVRTVVRNGNGLIFETLNSTYSLENFRVEEVIEASKKISGVTGISLVVRSMEAVFRSASAQ